MLPQKDVIVNSNDKTQMEGETYISRYIYTRQSCTLMQFYHIFHGSFRYFGGRDTRSFISIEKEATATSREFVRYGQGSVGKSYDDVSQAVEMGLSNRVI